MSFPKPTGSEPDLDFPFTIPELPRAADPMETPAPGELTTPQLPGLEPCGVTTHSLRPHRPRIPGFPDVPGYELHEEIARGGMGVVYAARELALGRDVAIKTLLPSMSGHRQMIDQFEREARITARLPHPGVPPIHALDKLPDGRPYLVMKLIRGRTLAAILTARSQRQSSESTSDLDLTTPDAPGLLLVFEQICQAVAFAHSQGIVHRDLKPQNIMVGPFGEVQVMDWGLAREMQKEKLGTQKPNEGPGDAPHQAVTNDSMSTQLGTAKGTPSYMPPEQARGEWHLVDARADVFALGGILCSVLTGLPPYTGTDINVVVGRAMDGDLGEAYARLDNCGASPDLVRLAKWCLSADPGARLTDARAMAGLVELYRLGQEEQLRTLETERAAVAGAEAAAWWAILRAVPRQVSNLRNTEGSSDRSALPLLTGVLAGVLIGLGVAYCMIGVFGSP